MELRSKREELIELANKLFVYTDSRQWQRLLGEVFKEEVLFDMASAGAGPAKTLSASVICDMWNNGFAGIDQVHHQSGNFIVDFKSDTEAAIFCYAIASHYKQAATQGKTREFIGSYELHASLTDLGWRLDGFKYNLKYINGNVELK
ncbi:nuclear transport factor 2 family protein [Fulvivirgaceae bacterium PWU4]|uniref:Nuclear transport factor 2 family protein n=1 Tax=Chryseosolibacter histidini TaxID=2782349 RepID=A0AAP2DTA9_9BACT|nr:nuclear transport factor 2 family protein [Chryseosolibacter histidini]MBT1701134.1 nuclear transport factor 2 family protein [Chryseosolibacter histidini]